VLKSRPQRIRSYLAPMANTYSQIYLHFVIVVKRRENLIPNEHKEEVHKYISGLVAHRGCKMLAIHCMPDHTHFFVGFKPVISISDFVKEIKVESNQFINSKTWMKSKFAWQEGYGVFSYSQSHLTRVINYIKNQERHHAKKKFEEEYRELLKKFEVSFEEKYLFEFFDNLPAE
jgi:putative transposase